MTLVQGVFGREQAYVPNDQNEQNLQDDYAQGVGTVAFGQRGSKPASYLWALRFTPPWKVCGGRDFRGRPFGDESGFMKMFV